jgi:electron transport complex protein RnfC
VPLLQHTGRAAIPTVREGEEVTRGQRLAKPDGELSVAMHAPATGVVQRIGLVPSASGPMVPGIYLKTLPASTQEVAEGTPCPVDSSPEAILDAIQNAGIVGLGGAAFPTHVKLRPPEGRRIDTLILNGAECEPYLTTDYRVMLEQTDDLLLGVRYLKKVLGQPRVIVAVEDHASAAGRSIAECAPPDLGVEVATLAVKYPQGAEKVLIKSLLGREVPRGGLPADAGACCVNVATTAEIGRLLPHGRGICERVITITGRGVADAGNYRIPIGTPLRFALERTRTGDDVSRVLLGGPMMGQAVRSLDVPITKGTSGIVVLTSAETGTAPPRSQPCIHCGYCVDACPLFLNPSKLGILARSGEYQQMLDHYHLDTCFECGACAYVCPSHLPLVQEFRAAKAILRRRERLSVVK